LAALASWRFKLKYYTHLRRQFEARRHRLQLFGKSGELIAGTCSFLHTARGRIDDMTESDDIAVDLFLGRADNLWS
jgi:hypothetical protein